MRSPSPARPLRMVALSDFSGLTSCACALASAQARAAKDSLERCMGGLRVQEIQAHRAGPRTLGPDTMTDGLFGVLGHESFELCPGLLMLEVGVAGASEHVGKFRPRIGRAHVDDPHRLDPGSGRGPEEEAGGLAALHATPELFLCRKQE